MALIRSDFAKGIKQLPTSGSAGTVVAARFEVDVSTLPTLANGDKLEIGGLPAFHTIVDYYLDNDDFDTNGAPTVSIGVGLMSGTFGDNDAARTVGTEFFSASSALQSAALTRGALATGLRIAPTTADRGIGITFTTAPATQPTTGKIALVVLYKQ